MSIEWTKAETDKLLAAIKGAPSVAEAVTRVAKAVPSRRVTYDVIKYKLNALNKPSLSTFLQPPHHETPEQATKEDLGKLRTDRRLAELESANKRLIKDVADREAELSAMRQLRASKPLPPVTAPKRVGATQRRGTPVMLCSDWHIEEQVHPKTVAGLNEYTPAIAEKCIAKLAEAFEWLLRDSRFDCREGVVWLGGDLYSGYIHEELTEGNAMSPVEAALWLQTRIEEMLRRIAATTKLERILVICNDGNHGRLTQKIRVATRTKNSLEWMLYHNLARRLSDEPRFQFQIADGEWNYLDIYKQTLAFTHGDSFKYQGGVGGLLIPVRRGINEMRKYRKVDHVAMGHFHQRLDLNDISVNGSMIGINPYSMRIHASPEPRQQSWFMLDSERGKCLSAPIWL
jgi:hypothetical protein